MPKFSYFDACVLVDGTPLPEYAESQTVDAAGVTTVSCWVPSEAGKSFSVQWKDARPASARPAIAGRVYADGVNIDGHLALAGIAGDSTVASKPVDGVARALIFSELDLTDDDAALNKGAHEHMGEIHLRVYRVRVLARSAFTGYQLLASEKVHERSKKAGAHRTQLGAALGAAPTMGYRVQQDGPMLVLFVFRYRPLALLQATDIVPLPPRIEAPPSRHSTGAGSRSATRQPERRMTQEELEEERRLEARLAELKRKRDGSTSPGRKKVKAEVKAEPLSHSGRFANGDVIDLTKD